MKCLDVVIIDKSTDRILLRYCAEEAIRIGHILKCDMLIEEGLAVKMWNDEVIEREIQEEK